MFEDKNINEFDLMMKSILDEGREEVPAGVWERVSEGLDKVAASEKKPAAVIWFRRAGIAAAAAAAAIAVGVVLNHGTEEALLPDTGDSSLIAVVEQETSAEEHAATVEESDLRISHKKIPHGRNYHRYNENKSPQNSHIRSDKRRKIKIIGLLQKIKQRAGKKHNLRRVVNHNYNAALHYHGTSGIGALRISEFRKGIPPILVQKTFGQGLMSH